MLVILAETLALVIILAATAIVLNVKAKTEKIGYRLDKANYYQCHIST
jgi:hypothetical protein